MAVQAQYMSNILPDLRNGSTNKHLDTDNPSLLASLLSNRSSTLLQDCELVVPGTFNKQQILHSTAPSPSAHPGANLPSAQRQRSRGNHSRHVSARPRRVQKHVDLPTAVQMQQHATLSVGDFHQPRRSSPMLSQTSVVVSTGLCLAFDNKRTNASTSASGTEFTSPKILSTPSADILALLLQQRVDIDKLLRRQAEQLKELLEEKRQKHCRALLVAIEESVSSRMGEKELELYRIKRRNMELEDRAKHLIMEAQMWQIKARSSEAMVATLRSNLQHAVAQSKEGCGDSEADDAASVRYEEKVRACRMCRTNKVSVLLLPCRHLCLCKDCETQVEICPLCQFVKKASVEVYMC